MLEWPWRCDAIRAGRRQPVGGYTTTDGINWQTIASPLTGPDIEFGNGVWLNTSATGERTSSDGINFGVAAATGLDVRSYDPPRFAGGRFVRYRRAIGAATATLAASTDGVAWTAFGDFPVPTASAGAGKPAYLVNDIACGDCSYVLAG